MRSHSSTRTPLSLPGATVRASFPSPVRATNCPSFVCRIAFDETGIALSVIRPLSENGIGIFLVSTFNTDYLLVKANHMDAVERHLRSVGHILL